MQTEVQDGEVILSTYPHQDAFEDDVAALCMLPVDAIKENRRCLGVNQDSFNARAVKHVVFSSGADLHFVDLKVKPVTPTEKALGIDPEIVLDGQRHNLCTVNKVYVVLHNCEGK